MIWILHRSAPLLGVHSSVARRRLGGPRAAPLSVGRRVVARRQVFSLPKFIPNENPKCAPRGQRSGSCRIDRVWPPVIARRRTTPSEVNEDARGPFHVKAVIGRNNVHLNASWKTLQFRLIWGALCLNVTDGIGAVSMVGSMPQDVFRAQLLGVDTITTPTKSQRAAIVAAAEELARLISSFNAFGRIFWATLYVMALLLFCGPLRNFFIKPIDREYLIADKAQKPQCAIVLA
jgi:hypothetical protein